MGGKPIPDYANIFMDQQLYKQLIGAAMGGKPIPDYANIFMAKLDKQIMQVTDGLFPDEIPFLDTQVEIKNNKIITDLYKKPTDRNMYLLPSSYHVASVSENIPYSLCLRIIIIIE